jgi:hypothetical protein
MLKMFVVNLRQYTHLGGGAHKRPALKRNDRRIFSGNSARTMYV